MTKKTKSRNFAQEEFEFRAFFQNYDDTRFVVINFQYAS